ncbi:MAG: hypothetical protein, partial [Olavius algarvensis Gamma 1 endosymbiont]
PPYSDFEVQVHHKHHRFYNGIAGSRTHL